MKKTVLLAVVCLGLTNHSFAQKSLQLKNSTDSVSYLIGMMNGTQFVEGIKQAPMDEFNFNANVAGYSAAVLKQKTLMTTDEAQNYLQTFFTQLSTKEYDENRQKGEAFLAKNKLEAGVIQTASGLQYKVIITGNGDKPEATDNVTVHYQGTTLEGKVFDSSYERNSPASFQLNQVIPGWTEGVQLMPVGSKYIFWIPSELAYGERGAGADIKPGETLVFEVELQDIQKPEQEEAPVVATVIDTTFRRVGDYERIDPKLAFTEVEGSLEAYELVGYSIALFENDLKILDKDKKELLVVNDSVSPVDEIALYSPLQEKAPLIVAATRVNAFGERDIIDIYQIDNQKNTAINAGRMNINLTSDVLIDSDKDILFFMNIRKEKSELRFSFDTHYVVYIKGEESVQVPTSDFYFVSTKKQGLQPAGEATRLSFFKEKK